jgi:hypothetical protein
MVVMVMMMRKNEDCWWVPGNNFLSHKNIYVVVEVILILY